MEWSANWRALIGAQFKRKRCRRVDESSFIPWSFEEIWNQAMPAIAGGLSRANAKARLASVRRYRGFPGSRTHRDKIVPVRCAADRMPPKSKSRAASDRGAEFGIQLPERHRAHPFQPTPAASHFLSLPNSASARRETARTVRRASPRVQRAPQPHVASREKLPAPSASRRASGNKSDKAVADFVFVPARQMVPEKLRALYVTGVTQAMLCPQIWFADKMVCVTSFATFSNVAPLPRRFPCC